MAEIDESVKVPDFMSLIGDWALDKKEKIMVKKLQKFHEKEVKNRALQTAKEERALKQQQLKEKRLEQKRFLEEEKNRVRLEKLQQKLLNENERKRKNNEKKEELELLKRQKLELKNKITSQRDLLLSAIKIMNGEFNERLPNLSTPRGALLPKNYSWLPDNLHSKLSSCKFSLPHALDEHSSIFYFQLTRDLNKPNMFVAIRGNFDRSQYYCSVVVHGLILMFALVQIRKRVIFIVDSKLDKVLFENDLLLAKFIQNRSMIKLFGSR